MPENSILKSGEFNFSLRPFNENDINFILSCLYQHFKDHPRYFGVEEKIFNFYFNNLWKKTLRRTGCIIACNPEHTDQIYGFVVSEYFNKESIIHFLYVKFPFRGFGLGRALWKKATSFFSEKGGLPIVTTIPYRDYKNINNNLSTPDKSFPKYSIVYWLHLFTNYSKKTSTFPYQYNPFLLNELLGEKTIPCARLVALGNKTILDDLNG